MSGIVEALKREIQTITLNLSLNLFVNVSSLKTTKSDGFLQVDLICHGMDNTQIGFTKVETEDVCFVTVVEGDHKFSISFSKRYDSDFIKVVNADLEMFLQRI